jgi:CRP-like cAMP-binding protein
MAGGTEELGFLTGDDARLLMDEALFCRFGAGRTVVEAGSRPNALFFLSRGAVRDGETRVEAPTLLGDLAFVDGCATLQRVVAEEPCEVYVIEGVRIRELVEWAPDFGARFYCSLAAQLAQRLRAATALSQSTLI